MNVLGHETPLTVQRDYVKTHLIYLPTSIPFSWKNHSARHIVPIEICKRVNIIHLTLTRGKEMMSVQEDDGL